jgi:hypothetical protein
VQVRVRATQRTSNMTVVDCDAYLTSAQGSRGDLAVQVRGLELRELPGPPLVPPVAYTVGWQEVGVPEDLKAAPGLIRVLALDVEVDSAMLPPGAVVTALDAEAAKQALEAPEPKILRAFDIVAAKGVPSGAQRLLGPRGRILDVANPGAVHRAAPLSPASGKALVAKAATPSAADLANCAAVIDVRQDCRQSSTLLATILSMEKRPALAVVIVGSPTANCAAQLLGWARTARVENPELRRRAAPEAAAAR